MTTPLRKPHSCLVGFQFRLPGFELEKSSKLNPPGLCDDVVDSPMFVRLASETLLSGLQKKSIETS